jgi:hypothetical protein
VEPVAIDTDVASLLIKRKLPADMARLLSGRPLVLTFVTLGELTRWVEQRPVGDRTRREMLDRWLTDKHILDSNRDVAAPGASSPPTPASAAAPAHKRLMDRRLCGSASRRWRTRCAPRVPP